MEETKDSKVNATSGATARTGNARGDEATSSETLSDLETTQTDRAGEGSSTDTAANATHSPDGTPDGPRGGRAEGSDPM